MTISVTHKDSNNPELRKASKNLAEEVSDIFNSIEKIKGKEYSNKLQIVFNISNLFTILLMEITIINKEAGISTDDITLQDIPLDKLLESLSATIVEVVGEFVKGPKEMLEFRNDLKMLENKQAEYNFAGPKRVQL